MEAQEDIGRGSRKLGDLLLIPGAMTNFGPMDFGKIRLIPGAMTDFGPMEFNLAELMGYFGPSAGEEVRQKRAPERVVPLSADRSGALFLEFGLGENSVGQYAHLLRKIDVPKVQHVVSRLQEQGLVVLLGGSVVDNAVFDGKTREYRDIDLVATGYKKDVVRMGKTLEDAEARQKDGALASGSRCSPFDYSTGAIVDGESVSAQIRFSVENVTSDRGDGVGYIGMRMPNPRDKKAIRGSRQVYCVRVFEPSCSQVSPIDISLVDRRVFEGALGQYKLPLRKPASKGSVNAGHDFRSLL